MPGCSNNGPLQPPGFTSASVLGNPTYNVAGNQGSGGNCFAWAAHRTMGVDLKRQTGVDDAAVVNETDGSNNCKASSSKITVYC